jgi:ribosomal protein L39E
MIRRTPLDSRRRQDGASKENARDHVPVWVMLETKFFEEMRG